MQKFFGIAGSVCIAAAIIMVFMFACNGCPDKKETVDKAAYDSSLAEQAERNREYQWLVDSLIIKSEDQLIVINTLNQTKELYKQIADKQKQQADKYADMYRVAKSLLDTNVMILSCDSLVDEYEILAGVHERTLQASDSVIMAQFRAIESRDTIIAIQQRWIKSQVMFMEESDSSYNALFDSKVKLQKRMVRQKRLGIAAVIAAFIGGVMLAK